MSHERVFEFCDAYNTQPLYSDGISADADDVIKWAKANRKALELLLAIV